MKRILGFLLVIALILALGGVVVGIITYTMPLGPTLNLATHNQSEPTKVPEVQSSGKAVCGSTGIMHLLVIGRASPNQSGMYGADAVRLVVVNFDAPSATVLALPAKLWVDSSVLADPSIQQTELSLIYQQAWENAASNSDPVRTRVATQALAQAIYDNFTWEVDHYVTVEDAAFIEFIDEVGGVDITLPEQVDGTADGYGIYPAGLNHLDGLRTLNFTRMLHPSGQAEPDWWGSLSRQDLILQGLLDAALNPVNLTNLPDLVKALRKAITTDLSVNQAMDLSCMLQQVGSSAVLEMVGPPPHLMTIDPAGHMLPDINAIIALLAQMEGGN
jgi:anionic cell wall polymer biosynthesis LytR-Cps2A-Psr (LCP) family protein